MENVTGKFAQAVLNRRKQLGLTQDELAKRIGTSKQMVSKYELGQRSPKVAMANAFATALETTLDKLIGTEPATTDEDRLEALHQNPRLGLLFDRARKMSPEDVEYMLRFADGILKERDEDV